MHSIETSKRKVSLYRSKSDESAREMENLLTAGFFAGAVDRAYYALFHMAQALLAVGDLEYSSHEAVIAAFGREYAKTKKVDPKFHRVLIDAFDLRLTADYDVEASVGEKEALDLIERARDFLKTIASVLDQSP